MRREWNAKSCHKATIEWIQRPGNDTKFLEDPLADLAEETYSDGTIGSTRVSLIDLSLWHGKLAAVELFRGDEKAGMSDVITASMCDFVNIVITANRRHVQPDFSARDTPQDHNLRLGRLIALGLSREAGVAAEKMTRGFAEGLYIDQGLALGSFVLRLYLRFLGFSEDIAGLPLLKSGPHLTILDHVFDVDPTPFLNPVLVDACQYHIEQSRDNTNREVFDITEVQFQFYPAEILAILRLREQRGLPPVSINHPLMDMPTAKLRPIQIPATYPEFLVDLITKMKAAAPAYADGL